MCYNASMRYNELKITVNKADLEILQALLIENGYVSMQIDDPDDVRDILEHKDTYRYDYINDALKDDMGRKPVVTLYFEDDEEGHKQQTSAATLLAKCKDDGIRLDLDTTEAGDDSEWLYKWQEFFKPSKVGERIVVKPSWEEYEAKDGELVIEMDPGMAFGSGLHETTSMCIKALERVLADAGEEAHTEPLRVLDVGCGTGVLAIAAALLGADEALGIDIDKDAVRVAQENIEHNGLSDKITAQYGNLTEGVDYKTDIIVANLMADLVMMLSPAAGDHLREHAGNKTGGWYITSGILDIKEEVVSEAIRAAGFTIVDVLHDGEWCAVIARLMD